MFVRVETGFKAEFSDPEALRLQRKIAEIHPTLAERIRWVRLLRVSWLEFDSTRDKVIQAVQAAFKNQVTDWVFTGDLLPSAAGASGTLLDLMQESPFRPGVFHGIEKRNRLQIHDEKATVILDMMQTILGRKSDSDRVATGEMLVVEGAKLSQSDLEWIARNWFANDRDESWSLFSEDELKRNARFQSEQVAKYLFSPNAANRSKLLQFRNSARGVETGFDWKKTEEALRSTVPSMAYQSEIVSSEDWSFLPEIRFSSHKLDRDTQNETEFHLLKNQLDHFIRNCSTRLQTVLAVLPEKNRLWRTELEGCHPVRIRDEFEGSLARVAETTDTAIALMKLYEETNEEAGACFWTSSVSVERPKLEESKGPARGNLVDLFYIGFNEQPAYSDIMFVEMLKSVHLLALSGKAIDFTIQASGHTLLECLKSCRQLQYGFDLVLDGISPWFKKYFESPMGLGLIWGVNPEQRDWLAGELKKRNLPYTHFGTTSLTGDIRLFDGGELCAKVNVHEFFGDGEKKDDLNDRLLDQPIYKADPRKQPARFKNRYSTEELVLKPEAHHVATPTPVVLRPELQNWSGLMALPDLCGQEFGPDYLDFLLRKCTAMGGQILTIQTSYLNGLKAWGAIFGSMERNYGILVSKPNVAVEPSIKAHWLALQIVAKVSDVRTVRTEEFKYVNDRIYWLPGDFEHPATRWLAGFEGRYQSGLHSAIAIESKEGVKSVTDTLFYALLKRKLGAEVRIQHHFPGGFFVSVSENERFAIEEEWRVIGVSFEFVGRVTAAPYLVIRNEDDHVQTIAIEEVL